MDTQLGLQKRIMIEEKNDEKATYEKATYRVAQNRDHCCQ